MLPPIDDRLHTPELIESLQKPAMGSVSAMLEDVWFQRALAQDAEISASEVEFLEALRAQK